MTLTCRACGHAADPRGEACTGCGSPLAPTAKPHGEGAWPGTGGTTPPADPAWMQTQTPPRQEIPSNGGRHTTERDTERVTTADPPRSATAAFSRAAIRTARRRVDERQAGLLLRGLARGVDTIILLPILGAHLALGALAYGLEEIRAAGEGSLVGGCLTLAGQAPGLGAAIFLLLFLLVSTYFVLFHGALSRTPGKALFGLWVVNDHDLPIGFSRALARWAAFVLSVLLFGLGLLWTAFSEVQQGLHDKIAGTYVKRFA